VGTIHGLKAVSVCCLFKTQINPLNQKHCPGVLKRSRFEVKNKRSQLNEKHLETCLDSNAITHLQTVPLWPDNNHWNPR
jgi:hypothetical protein